jgi:hypothetical protein
LLALLVALGPIDGRPKPHYTFILPEGYVGWVQVVFNDPEAARLPIRRDAGREIDVPESGMPRTSDLRNHDSRAQDEFYYRSVGANGKTVIHRVPPEYVIPGEGDGGFGVMDTGDRGPGYSWFLFIGPPEVRERVPLADSRKVIAAHTSSDGHFTRIMATVPYPTPGRMALPPSPQR